MPKAVVVKKLRDFFKKGELIVREGEEGGEMYIIKSGKVEVVKKTGDEEVVLATLEPKAFFGEMALFGDPKRSATIRAAEDTEMLVINKEMLDSQLERVPHWFTSILKNLVDRLRAANQAIRSRFKVSFEYSVLTIINLQAKVRGEDKGSGYILELESCKRECSEVLGITEEEFMEKLKNLSFIGIVKYSEPKDQIIIPDRIKLHNFLAYLKAKCTGGTEEDTKAVVQDENMHSYFEKIYKLLFRRKF